MWYSIYNERDVIPFCCCCCCWWWCWAYRCDERKLNAQKLMNSYFWWIGNRKCVAYFSTVIVLNRFIHLFSLCCCCFCCSIFGCFWHWEISSNSIDSSEMIRIIHFSKNWKSTAETYMSKTWYYWNSSFFLFKLNYVFDSCVTRCTRNWVDLLLFYFLAPSLASREKYAFFFCLLPIFILLMWFFIFWLILFLFSIVHTLSYDKTLCLLFLSVL